MRIAIPFFMALALFSVAQGAASWKKVAVSGGYPGRGETSLSQCAGNKLCLLGGRGSNRVNIFDTKTLEWKAGSSNSLEMHHFQGFQGPDNCVWIVGAWTGPFPSEVTIDNIWRYCPDMDKWFKDEPIPRPRGSAGAVYYKGKVYLVTGNVGGHREGAKVVKWFDSYDPKTGEWEQLPDIPHARDHSNAVVLDNKLYVAGGRRSTSNLPEFFDDTVVEVDVYDFSTGKWSTVTDLGRPRGGTASAVLDGKVYVIGGEGDNRAWTEVDVLSGNKFQTGPDMPEPRHGTGVVSCNGAIWIAGGERVLGAGNSAKDTFAFFDGDKPPVCTGRGGESSSSEEDASPPNDTTSGATGDNSSSSEDDASPPNVTTSGATGDNSSSSEDDASAPNDTASGAVGSGETSSSPSAEPSSTSNGSNNISNNNDDDPACFPSDASVELEDGSTKAMSLLRIGDRVKVAHPNEFSAVYFFSHKHPSKQSEFVSIKTSMDTATLSLSPGHLLYVNGALTEAAKVRVGDKVSVSHDMKTATVTEVSRVQGVGLHNPHTIHGDIVVNGVVANTKTSAVPGVMANVLLSPFKIAFHMATPSQRLESMNKAVLRALDIVYWRV